VSDGKAEFSAVISPGFSVILSFRNHPEIISSYYQCWKQI